VPFLYKKAKKRQNLPKALTINLIDDILKDENYLHKINIIL